MSSSRALVNCPIPSTVKQKPKKAALYDSLMEERHKNEIALKYGSKKIASHELQ
jgi:hypothetical protein